MSPEASEHFAALDSVIESTIAPQAAEIDRTGAFPRASIDALAKAGLLGLISAEEVGGKGAGMAEAAHVVERLAGACGSTAMIVLMHYAATALVEAHGSPRARQEIARNEHLTTLAFSEAGSRSHFWAPLGTATRDGGRVRLDSDKSWVTAAGEADSYVWSSRPIDAEGPMSIWLVPSRTEGLEVRGPFDGFGLRGNASNPIKGQGITVETEALLGADGKGLDQALQTGLPYFLVLNASFSIGLMEALLGAAREHLLRTRLEHLDQTLADQPLQRARFARVRTLADTARAFRDDTLAALGTGREDATLRVLQVKAVAGEAAAEVADEVMRLCGGSAFRKSTGVERLFRDALAARVMAPTTEALHDFVGRATLGLPLF
ncbi:acyl-CoA dehydrogenase family protein [Nonomuraea sp. AD125B]|uniref:acyl-CoA dehydrogenase family protein n=1 Tax=Nonomuraea sp. AD125B TaxID=3242897 RepID=UPI003529A1AE